MLTGQTLTCEYASGESKERVDEPENETRQNSCSIKRLDVLLLYVSRTLLRGSDKHDLLNTTTTSIIIVTFCPEDSTKQALRKAKSVRSSRRDRLRCF